MITALNHFTVIAQDPEQTPTSTSACWACARATGPISAFPVHGSTRTGRRRSCMSTSADPFPRSVPG